MLSLFICLMDCKWDLSSAEFIILFYNVGNSMGYFLGAVCWLIRCYIFYYVYILNFKFSNAPFL